MYKNLQIMAFEQDTTFSPTDLGIVVKDITAGICPSSSNVDSLRTQNNQLKMEIEPTAEFKEWMDRKYGQQCDSFEASMYTAIKDANQNLLDTCDLERQDILDEWYFLLVTIPAAAQMSQTIFEGEINVSFTNRNAA